MRLLFDMDKKDYADCTHTFVRNSARSIIIRDAKVAMIHSRRYGYYKFPGGGIEADEDPIDAMIRETLEEAGLIVIRKTVRPYGYVHRIQKSMKDETECFIQDNLYYLCDAETERVHQQLDGYEAEEQYELSFIDAQEAILRNSSIIGSPYHPMMFERENRVLQMLIREGLLN